MGRPPRLTYPDARHHVFNRAAGRQPLFADDHDRRTFLALLRDAYERFSVKAHAFCLMGNHFHLVLHTPTGELSETMHFHGSAYTRYFNRRHGRDGPLYRARFASTVVNDDGHLLELTRYVHRNPLDIRPAVPLASYRWSSYPIYLGTGHAPPWLDATTVLDLHGDDDGYRTYVEADRSGDRTSGPEPPNIRADKARRPVPSASELLAAIDRVLDDFRSQLPPPHPRATDEPERMVLLTALLVASELGVRAPTLRHRYGYANDATVRSAIRRARARVATDRAFAALVGRVVETVGDRVDRP